MSDLRGLYEVLCAQCDVHRKLLELEDDKTRFLLAGDTEKLISLLNDQQALLMRGRELEKQRNTLCLSTEYKTLRELVESGGEHKALFGMVFEELSEVVMALKKKCTLNKKLLETRLGTIRFLLNQSGMDSNSNTYTKNAGSRG